MRAVLTIFGKELRTEFRNKQMINSSLILSLMILATFRFAFLAFDIEYVDIASPIIWVTFFFSGMFALSLVYKKELDQGTGEGLLLAPVSPSSIFFGKFFATLVVVFGMEIVSLVLFFLFFPVDIPDLLALGTLIFLGTVGFVALGNLISAISANLAKSEIMLFILLVPLLLFTIVMSTLSATNEVFTGATLLDVLDEVRLIVAFDVVYLILGHLLIKYVIED